MDGEGQLGLQGSVRNVAEEVRGRGFAGSV